MTTISSALRTAIVKPFRTVRDKNRQEVVKYGARGGRVHGQNWDIIEHCVFEREGSGTRGRSSRKESLFAGAVGKKSARKIHIKKLKS